MQGSLAKKLRVLRAEKQLTMRAAADLVGIRPQTLSDIEHGYRAPHDITLAKIAEAYQVPLDELIEEPTGKAPANRRASSNDGGWLARTTCATWRSSPPL